jgi:histidyl-tRNA synthetase
LREKGFAVEYSLTASKSEKQFKRATELKARFTVRLVAAQQGGLEVKFKNLATREEKTVSSAEARQLDLGDWQ